MLSSTQTLAPKPALPPAAAAPAPATPANATGGPSFAQFLTQQASPAEPAADASSSADAEASEPTQTAATRALQARKQAAAPAKPANAEARPAAGAPDKTAGKTDGKDGVEATTTTPDDEADRLDELTQLIGLASGQPAPAPLAPDAASGASRGSRAAGKDSDPPAARTKADGDRLAELPGAAMAARAADTQHGKQAEMRADMLAAGHDADVTQGITAANTAATAAGPQPLTTDATLPNFAAVLAQALPTAAARPDATPEASPPLQAPLHSPAFAPELGVRVSLLAVDGVQQAELTLNPADMGPVSVQIVVDGSQAQVSFHAAQAETRQVLEQSLPDLAAALQGQGLTLSGGGVFQQAPRDADHAGEPGERGDGRRGSTRVGAAGGGSTGAAPAAQRRTVGLLDTFA